MLKDQLKYLEFIQNVINRMSANSFQIKIWTIVLVSAFLALYGLTRNNYFIFIGVFSTLAFWILDSYYATQEIKYQGLYDDVAGLSENPKRIKLFEMKTDLYEEEKYSFLSSFLSSKVFRMHISLIIILAGFIAYSNPLDKKKLEFRPRKVFFSFNNKDAFRARTVIKSWISEGKIPTGFINGAEYEKIKKKDDNSIKNWINYQLEGTSVTVILVGKKTCDNPLMKYVIDKSIEKGNGLLGIDVSKIRDSQGKLSERCGRIPKRDDFYLWNKDNGMENMGNWIEIAALKAGK